MAKGRKKAPAPAASSVVDDAGHGPMVVGIGASAGGLAALKELFQHAPAQSGLAYVVVVHLSPDHESHLAELLQPHVAMPVQQVTETVALEPDRVYVIPPNANISAIDTHLRLSAPPEPRWKRMPIDHFLRTMSRMHDGRGIAVILSGTGSDGTLGLREVKEKGGLTIVQDPREAEYDGMPQSALATGMVDMTLPVAEMPAAILRYAQVRPRVSIPTDGEAMGGEARRLLQSIFTIVRTRTGRDFTRYKPSTVLRRVARRMQLAGIDELPAYLDHLRDAPDEIGALADDLLVSVTSFFRDAEVFEALEKGVIPQLVERAARGGELRLWSVGCATGEEAYSLAMLLIEATSDLRPQPRFQIFASDLNEAALERARDGFYLGDIEADIGAERLHRFFEKESGGYRVRSEVRERVIFAPHNLLSDPPFSRLHLIACRNVLIYLEREVQRDVYELFHYALRPDGYLVLGPSERVDFADLFQAVDKKQAVYRSRGLVTRDPRLPVFPVVPVVRPDRAPAQMFSEPLAFGTLHQRMMDRYALPSLLVSPEDRIVHLSTHAGRYLVHPVGDMTANVYKLVREDLRLELRSLLQELRAGGQPQRTQPIPVTFEHEVGRVVLDVRRAEEAEGDGFVLVVFDERMDPLAAAQAPRSMKLMTGESEESLVERLVEERDAARHRLQSIVEENETSREEMRASNEELQSSNEELRSTLEELETSKEELQSINEELSTVNQENRHKVEELAQLSNDLQNLLGATDIATLFLDRGLRILRFTPRTEELFNLRASDRGRPLSDITHRLVDGWIIESARQVLATLVPQEREVADDSGHWYLGRVLPYRSADDRIEGVVMTFVDITSRKDSERALRDAQATLARELDASRRLHQMMIRAFESTDAQEMLDGVLVAVLELQGADFGSIHLLRDDGALDLVAQVGLTSVFQERYHDVTAGGPTASARALRTGQAVIIPDVMSDPESEPLREAFAAQDVRSVQAIPVVRRGDQLLGVITTHFRQLHTPSAGDGRLMDVVAQQTADVIERIRSDAEVKRLNETLEERVEARTREVRALASTLTRAEQEERRRIAQLLHDDLQQLLYGIQMTLSLAREKTLGGDRDALLAETDRSLMLLDTAVTRTRQLTVDLNPPVLEHEGLVGALQWLQTQMQDLYQLHVRVHGHLSHDAIPRDLQVLLFQVIRELLFNVTKHADTQEADVDIEEEQDGLRIVVRDDGKGFDPEAAEWPHSSSAVGGLGLFSVRERVRLHGGEAEFHTRPGKGTRVAIYVPKPSP